MFVYSYNSISYYTRYICLHTKFILEILLSVHFSIKIKCLFHPKPVIFSLFFFFNFLWRIAQTKWGRRVAVKPVGKNKIIANIMVFTNSLRDKIWLNFSFPFKSVWSHQKMPSEFLFHNDWPSLYFLVQQRGATKGECSKEPSKNNSLWPWMTKKTDQSQFFHLLLYSLRFQLPNK